MLALEHVQGDRELGRRLLVPAQDPLDLTVNPGSIFPIVYRSRDNAWVDIFVGGNEMVWVPTSTIAVDINQLAFPPSHIFGSGLGGGDNYGDAAGNAAGGGARFRSATAVRTICRRISASK